MPIAAARSAIPHLKDVQSQVIQEPIRRVEAAFAARKDRGYGFPRFKKFGQYRSMLFPQFKTHPIRGNEIKLPKIALMSIVLHRPIPDGFAVKTVRVIRKHSRWYATLCCQIDVDLPEVMPSPGHSIGIDVGLEYFLSSSDGWQVERPRFFGKLQRQLKLLQPRLKRMQQGSNNRAKLIKKIGRVHEQVAASRLDWQFKLAHKLCYQARNIFVEDIDFRVMAKGFLGKHTLDAGLGQFLNQVLPWVCFKLGVYLGKVDPNRTSQTCPDCGAWVRKDLSVRVHECHECGSVKPRDVARAEVIKARGLSGMEMACGWDLSGAALSVLPRQDRVKQECLGVILEARVLSERWTSGVVTNNRSIKLLSPVNSRSVECIVPQTKRSVHELTGTQTISRLPIHNQLTSNLFSYKASWGWETQGVLAERLQNFNISESYSPHYIALTNLRRKEGLNRILTEVYEVEEPSIHSILIRLVTLSPPDADSPDWKSFPLTMRSDWTVSEVVDECEKKLKRESAVTRVNVDAIIDYSGFQAKEVNLSKLDCRLNLSEAVSKAFQVWKRLSLRQLVRGLGGDENHWRILVQPVANLSSAGVIKKQEDLPHNRLEQVYELINPGKLAKMDRTILTPEQIELIKRRAKGLAKQQAVVRSDDPASVDKQF